MEALTGAAKASISYAESVMDEDMEVQFYIRVWDPVDDDVVLVEVALLERV